MKSFILIATLIFCTELKAGEDTGRCSEYDKVRYDDEEGLRLKAECQCKAPGEEFVLDKIKGSFQLGESEQLLKEVVTDQKNYQSREQVKALYRRLKFARVLEKRNILQSMEQEFDLMIDGAGLRPGVQDFPTNGATATFAGSPGSITMKLQGLRKIEGLFLVDGMAEKIDPVISIHYFYPIDRYEYVISYQGKEIHQKEALTLIQEDFQTSCYNRFWENVNIRRANAKARTKSYGTKGGGQ